MDHSLSLFLSLSPSPSFSLTCFSSWNPICPVSMLSVFRKLAHGVYTTLYIHARRRRKRRREGENTQERRESSRHDFGFLLPLDAAEFHQLRTILNGLRCQIIYRHVSSWIARWNAYRPIVCPSLRRMYTWAEERSST
jgi:hypothetical protein